MRPPKTESSPPVVDGNEPAVAGAVPAYREPITEKIQTEIETSDETNGELVRKVAGVVLSIVREDSFSGPLPHPKHLAEYDRVLPGAANRIIAMAEKEQEHRHQWEDRSLKFDFSYSILGIILGFLIALALLILAYVSSQSGHPTVSMAFLAASTVGMVASFINGRSWLKDAKSDPDKTPETSAAKPPVSKNAKR
jgi:uncharacterized membrane protein